MTLNIHRSPRGEDLADALARTLIALRPADPFEALPVVVGSRGMERWLRHELATRLGIACRLEFLFPGTAFEAAGRWLSAPSPDPRAPLEAGPRAAGAWSGAPLVSRVLVALRARREASGFEAVRRYLDGAPGTGDAVTAREALFAAEVAKVLERLHHDRPGWALELAKDPGREPAHGWLGVLLADLGSLDPGSPARVLQALVTRAALRFPRPLLVYGLSTLRPGDRLRLEALARHLDVHLFSLIPSTVYWQHVRERREVVAELKRATADAERERLALELASSNALLSTLGAPSQHLQLWIEGLDYTEPGAPELVEPEPAAPPGTLLGALQAFVRIADENPPAVMIGEALSAERAAEAPWRALRGCASFAVHACHGALRQCEVLREELLARFAADPTLEPRHVLVMTPDLAAHAPLIASVFARASGAGGPKAIPVHIADLGLTATSAVAELLLRLLRLGDERVTAAALVDLVSLPPVRARFGLDDEDLAAVRALAVESGMRWAWDAGDRARHGQPALDTCTLRFGLERLALGVLMDDEGGFEVLPAASGLGPAVPLPLRGRDRVARFGALAEVADRVRAAVEALAAPRRPAEWRASLLAVVDDLTDVLEGARDDDQATRRARLVEALEEALPDDAVLPLDRRAATAVLAGALEHGTSGDRPPTGAVTVSGMEPMRSVPFRVVAIVGLDDGAFPRPGRPAAWDPFAERRFGEHDRREVDRHLFLEALLSARDAFLLFGTGFEPKRGAAVPLSVVVQELVDLVSAGLGVAPPDVLARHPLQPWSAAASFDAAWVACSRALHGERVPAGLWASQVGVPWPDADLPATLDASTLAAALEHPQRALLRDRAQLHLVDREGELEDREPLELDDLDRWKLKDTAHDAGLGDAGREGDLARLEDRLRGEGRLPLSAAGREVLEGAIEDVRAMREAIEALGPAEPPRALSARVGGVEVTAAVADVRAGADGPLFVRGLVHAKPSDRARLEAWIALLVARASGEAVAGAVVQAVDEASALLAPPADVAAAHLATLLDVYRQVRSGPALLLHELSAKVGAVDAEDPEARAAAIRARAGDWEGGPRKPGMRDDDWVKPLFGHWSIEDVAARADEVHALARAVWGPVDEAVKAAKTAKDAEKAAEKARKAAEKEAEKEAEKAAKEAEKARKAAEKEAEKARKAAEKEAEKAAKAAGRAAPGARRKTGGADGGGAA